MNSNVKSFRLAGWLLRFPPKEGRHKMISLNAWKFYWSHQRLFFFKKFQLYHGRALGFGSAYRRSVSNLNNLLKRFPVWPWVNGTGTIRFYLHRIIIKNGESSLSKCSQLVQNPYSGQRMVKCTMVICMAHIQSSRS